MGTRSTIAIEYSNGAIEQVYCNWDGYLSNNGKILLNHYMDPEKVRELINLGYLASLREDIGVKHPFDNPHQYNTVEWEAYREQYGKMCTFYGRDRGEDGHNALYFKDYDTFLADGMNEEYDYILRNDGVWYVNQGEGFEPLMEAYIEVLRQEHEESISVVE